MVNMYCYSKDELDKNSFIDKFARSCNATSVYKHERFTDGILVFRTRAGWAQNIIQECWKTGQQFIFIDTGYFFNKPRKHHRMTWNNFQLTKIIDRPSDRWEIFQRAGMELKPWRKNGSNILVCPPTEKSLYIHGLTQSQWIDQTMKQLKHYTDRKIIIRTKPPPDQRRMGDSLQQCLIDNDIHVLVTGESGSAIEAIMDGIPAIVSDLSAAAPVAVTNIADIDNLVYPDREKWIYSLSYGMFSNDEVINGTAYKILMDINEKL